MAKGKIPPALKGYQFTKGSTAAAAAGAKGGRVSPTKKAAAAKGKGATKGKG